MMHKENEQVTFPKPKCCFITEYSCKNDIFTTIKAFKIQGKCYYICIQAYFIIF